MKDIDKMSDNELRDEVVMLRHMTQARAGCCEFVYTVTGRHKSPQMCYREEFRHTAMDQWVRCHLVEDLIVLGPPRK